MRTDPPRRFFSLDRAIAQPLAALPPYGCGIPLAGTARFSFGKTKREMGGALGQAGNPAGFPVQLDSPPPPPPEASPAAQ